LKLGRDPWPDAKVSENSPTWDSNLGGRIWCDCEPFLEAAETPLVAAKYGRNDDTLVFPDP
jgi:hypothetical protein